MKLVLGFLVGLAIGIGAEQLWHRRYDRGASSRPRGSVLPGRRRRVVMSVLATVVVLLVVTMVGTYAYATSQFDKIEKVPVGGVLSGAPGGTNYLLVGTDNRPGVSGNRSDTMLVLRTQGSKSWIMSLPRDLFVAIPGQDGQHRINSAYNSGPQTLVRTVQETLGIPLDRYIEINFVSFAGLVDAIGGVTIDFPHPATDPKSGLDIQQTGAVELNGAQALAYVRSRTYTETIDGQHVVDGTADLGRVKRQQAFLRAVLSQAGASRNPFHLRKIGESLTAGLKIDDHMTLIDGLRFAWNMGRLNPQSLVLPTTPTTTSGGAQVLLLQEQAAQPILQTFRG
ncbi:MAG: LCP family protein [Acidimicrobiia bacterium]|nr:LCP family protein [Acidimicrobiia bacterium]